MANIVRRTGFSLIEALVVLAIGGMALSIIFSIGIKAGDSGFSLGRRAMAAADADVATSDVRAVFRSFSLPPSLTVRDDIDESFEGRGDAMEGEIVMERATQCAPQGWAGRLTLELAPVEGGGLALICRAGDSQAILMSLRNANAGFAYSRDGQAWHDTVTTEPPPVNARDLRAERLFIRLRAEGEGDIVERAATGVPLTWLRTDEF